MACADTGYAGHHNPDKFRCTHLDLPCHYLHRDYGTLHNLDTSDTVYALSAYLNRNYELSFCDCKD